MGTVSTLQDIKRGKITLKRQKLLWNKLQKNAKFVL